MGVRQGKASSGNRRGVLRSLKLYCFKKMEYKSKQCSLELFVGSCFQVARSARRLCLLPPGRESWVWALSPVAPSRLSSYCLQRKMKQSVCFKLPSLVHANAIVLYLRKQSIMGYGGRLPRLTVSPPTCCYTQVGGNFGSVPSDCCASQASRVYNRADPDTMQCHFAAPLCFCWLG